MKRLDKNHADVIKASDILAELDMVIIETKERARVFNITDRNEEAEFADNVYSGLNAFRTYLRSHEFLLKIRALNINKSKGN